MKFLLDEMYSSEIARLLRDRGHDVVAVKELPDLVEKADEAILAAATAEHRVLVTENVRDLKTIVDQWGGEEREHFGVVFASSRSVPRRKRVLGRLVEALDRYLQVHTREDELKNSWDWLTPATRA